MGLYVTASKMTLGLGSADSARTFPQVAHELNITANLSSSSLKTPRPTQLPMALQFAAGAISFRHASIAYYRIANFAMNATWLGLRWPKPLPSTRHSSQCRVFSLWQIKSHKITSRVPIIYHMLCL